MTNEPDHPHLHTPPPTKCALCRFGCVVNEIVPLEIDGEDAVWRKGVGVDAEVSFCSNPRLGGRPGDPVEMPNVVLDCEGFLSREIKLTRAPHGGAKVKRKRDRREARRGRRGR